MRTESQRVQERDHRGRSLHIAAGKRNTRDGLGMVANTLHQFGHVFVAARDDCDLDIAFETAELLDGNAGAFADQALLHGGGRNALDRWKHAHLHAPREIFALRRGFMRDILRGPLLYGAIKSPRIGIINQIKHAAHAAL